MKKTIERIGVMFKKIMKTINDDLSVFLIILVTVIIIEVFL